MTGAPPTSARRTSSRASSGPNVSRRPCPRTPRCPTWRCGSSSTTRRSPPSSPACASPSTYAPTSGSAGGHRSTTRCWRNCGGTAGTGSRTPPGRDDAPLTVITMWAHSRSASTAFLRMMIERGDVTVVHEPFLALTETGEVRLPSGDVPARSEKELLARPAGLRQGGPRLRVRVPAPAPRGARRHHPHLHRPRPEADDQLALRGEAHGDLSGDRLRAPVRAVRGGPGGDRPRPARDPRGAAGPRAGEGGRDLLRPHRAALPPRGPHLGGRRPARVATAPRLARRRGRQRRLPGPPEHLSGHRREQPHTHLLLRPPPAVLRAAGPARLLTRSRHVSRDRPGRNLPADAGIPRRGVRARVRG